MGDYERCADLCDDRGFARQAALLREVGSGRGRAYVVEESRWVDDEPERDEAGEPGCERPRTAFLDREHAERFGRELSARALRGFVARFDMRTGGYFSYIARPSRDEFCAQVGGILGRHYRLPGQGEPLISGLATDKQLLRILPLLRLTFCRIVAVEIAP